MPLRFEGYQLRVVLDELSGDRVLVFVDRNLGIPTHTFKIDRDDAVQIGHDLIGADAIEQMAHAWTPEEDQRVAVAPDEPTTVPVDWQEKTPEPIEPDRQQRTAPHGDVLPPAPVEAHDPYPRPYVPEEIAEEEPGDERPES